MKLPKCMCQHRFSQLPALPPAPEPTQGNTPTHTVPRDCLQKPSLQKNSCYATLLPGAPRARYSHTCSTLPALHSSSHLVADESQSTRHTRCTLLPTQHSSQHATMQERCFQLPTIHGRKSSTRTVPRRAPRSSPLPQAPLQTLHLRHLLSSEG